MNSAFLATSDIVNFKDQNIATLAEQLASDKNNKTEIAKACFNYVRDEIMHTGDFNMLLTTCGASDVLAHKTGWCYAKSHLLCALLRANNIPCGFSYQRLSVNDDGAPYSLHGLNALYLDEYGWFKVDARGNRDGKDGKSKMFTEFIAGQDSYAFALNPEFDEYNMDEVLEKPLTNVVDALMTYTTSDEMRQNFPDV